VGVFT